MTKPKFCALGKGLRSKFSAESCERLSRKTKDTVVKSLGASAVLALQVKSAALGTDSNHLTPTASLYYKRKWVYIIMFLNKISKEKFLWNSIYFLTLHALHIMPITNLAQINMNYE